MSQLKDNSEVLIDYELEEELEKIRNYRDYGDERQKKLCVILSSVEESLTGKKNAITYLLSFLSLLDESLNKDQIHNEELALYSVFFLNLILSFISKKLLKEKFQEIISKLLIILFNEKVDTCLVKTVFGCCESIFLAQDRLCWKSNEEMGPKQVFRLLLDFTFDHRPKVRKRALNFVEKIIINYPNPKNTENISSSIAFDFSYTNLTTLIKDKKNYQSKIHTTKVRNSLNLIIVVISCEKLKEVNIKPFCETILNVIKIKDQYLTSLVYFAFSELVKANSGNYQFEYFPYFLDLIFSIKPSVNDKFLILSWITVITEIAIKFSYIFDDISLKKISEIFTNVIDFLKSTNPEIQKNVILCLTGFISESFDDDLIFYTDDKKKIDLIDKFLVFLSGFIENNMLTLNLSQVYPEVSNFIIKTVSKFSYRVNPTFLNILFFFGSYRNKVSDSLLHNKKTENVVSAFIKELGPELILKILPISFKNDCLSENVWLLPLFRLNIEFSNLSFFKSEFLTLLDFCTKKKNDTKNPKLKKDFEILIDQIWSIFPRFCILPRDLKEEFDDNFAVKCSDLLLSKVNLRSHICHGLASLVESNLTFIQVSSNRPLIKNNYSNEFAQSNLDFLKTKSYNILSVLLNVFSSTNFQKRDLITSTIESYLKILPDTDFENHFNKVSTLLKTSIDKDKDEEKINSKNRPNESLSETMMDLLIIFAKYANFDKCKLLLTIFTEVVSVKNFPSLQKKSYKLLNVIFNNENGKKVISLFLDDVREFLIKHYDDTHSSARYYRLNFIFMFLDLVSESLLYFIPCVLQEIIISTKDVNEKTREVSFKILKKMAIKMAKGGIIEKKKITGMSSEIEDSEASLKEFFIMLSVGLAAQTPYMISATILSITYLIYEFINDLSIDYLLDISLTIDLFLTHNSREIAKSALGFVKMEVIFFPEEHVRPKLKDLIEKLLKWSHEHKGHFALKVKHIIERMMRRFGENEIESLFPLNDKKLLSNIKKTRSRLKKQKQNKKSDKHSTIEQFCNDNVSSDSDDDFYNNKNNIKSNEQFILETDDNPIDLLSHGIVTNMKSTRSDKKNKEPVIFDSDGKIMISNDGTVSNIKDKKPTGVNHYLHALKHGPVRGQNNKLKFKRVRDSDSDIESSDNEEVKNINNGNKKKKLFTAKSNTKLNPIHLKKQKKITRRKF